ncbi:hypothetical protein SNE40_010782 [Patella caerulea]|uniref:Uncharacterized protein n=1 Tax=Patella caerulea TaxID=87958 RepID=A0AAN8JSN9_PATCE
MIETLRESQYVVLTKEEFNMHRRPPQYLESTPNAKQSRLNRFQELLSRSQHLPGTAKSSSAERGINPKINVTGIPYNEVPKLPMFSGDEPPQKGDTTFDVWRFEVACIISDKSISEHSSL